MILLLDLHGVCCDFNQAFCDWYKFDYDPMDLPKVENRYPLVDLLGISESEIHRMVTELPVEWWEEIPEYPWYRNMYKIFDKFFHQVVFCTAPSCYPNAPSGVLKWMMKRFGSKFKDYSITNLKGLLSMRGRILIDDTDHNVGEFTLKNPAGDAYLFPQPWNSTKTHPDCKVIADWIEETLNIVKILHHG